MMFAAVTFIVLHAVSGREVYINPQQIISMAEAGTQVTDKAECIITLTDAKFTTVRETCAEVRRLMEQAR
jgi:hypothetical protein